MKRLTGLIILALAGCGALAASSLGQGSSAVGLAFIKDSRATTTVWVAAANGTGARKLGVGEGALLSPNGQLVASAGFGAHPGLLVYKVGGGTLAGVPPLTKDTVMPLAWSPDSTYLAVELYDTKLGSGPGNAAVDVIDVATGQVTATAAGVVEGASFAPTGSDRVVFGLTQSQTYSKPANLYTLPADGSAPATQITHEGHSIDPVWGAHGIVFVRTRNRGKDEAPAYHLELLNGTTVTAIASPKPSALVDGLYPVAISSDGTHVVAEYAGEDTSQAYAVNLATNRFKQLGATQDSAQGWGISKDGTRVLISHGGFENPSKYSTIATVPFGGGKPTTLVKGGDFPSWNQ
jgi:hypothetical protein